MIRVPPCWLYSATAAGVTIAPGRTSLRDLPVAARVIQVGGRIDDPADRSDLKLVDLGEHLVSRRRVAGVDNERSLVGDLDRNVAARAADQVDVPLDRDDDQLIAKLRVIRSYTGLDVLGLHTALARVFGRSEDRLRNLRRRRRLLRADAREQHDDRQRGEPRRWRWEFHTYFFPGSAALRTASCFISS